MEPEDAVLLPIPTERGQIFDTSILLKYYCDKYKYILDFAIILGLYTYIRRILLKDYKI